MKKLEEKINGDDVRRIRRMLLEAYQAGFASGAEAASDPSVTAGELLEVQASSGPDHLNLVAGEGILGRFAASEFLSRGRRV